MCEHLDHLPDPEDLCEYGATYDGSPSPVYRACVRPAAVAFFVVPAGATDDVVIAFSGCGRHAEALAEDLQSLGFLLVTWAEREPA